MTTVTPSSPRSPRKLLRPRRLDRWVLCIGLLFIGLVIIAALWLIINLQQRTTASKAQELTNLSLVLSQDTERAFQALETVQSSIIERLRSEEITTTESFFARASQPETHGLLNERAAELPYVDAITIINRDGKLLNFSRYWPIPDINVTDRDYFRALDGDPELESFVSAPVQNRGDGSWTIYLARKYRDPAGDMLGMVLGAMRLDYFERFYGTINVGDGGAISLFRSDGLLLVRSPPMAEAIGRAYVELLAPSPPSLAAFHSRPVTQAFLLDGQERLVAARPLERYPVTIMVSASLASVAATWRPDSLVIGGSAAMLCLFLAACIFLGLRQLDAQYRLSDAAHHMARHDALTDLPNRVLFTERLRALVQSGSSMPTPLAILLIDLDYFKSVNDTLGHPSGDALLCIIATRLQSCVGEGDLVTRLGGDEFAILHAAPGSQDETEALARRVVDTIAIPCDIDGNHVVPSASVGVTFAPHDGSNADELLKNADLALYRAKAEGRGGWKVFEPGMQKQVQVRRIVEMQLREAISNDGFELFYQPVVHARTGELGGFEALLRWRHADPAMSSPGQFIPVAEETGLIIPIGRWVLEQACLAAAKWPQHLRIAVNVSACQFRSNDLVAHVQGALRGAGLAPERLELEITETVLLKEDAQVRLALDQLRRMGVAISLDDFGTGYSSLSYLRRFPADRIKIDISFVRNICHDAGSAGIVRATVDLARSLGMATTAEGVESQAQWDVLKQAGCDEIQGYFVGRPGPLSTTWAILGQHG